MKVKPVTQTVTKQFRSGNRISGKEEESSNIEILSFETEALASTTVKLGMTINLGDYESVRCDVMTTVPHYVEEADDAFLYALKNTEEKLQLACGNKKAISVLSESIKAELKNG